MKREEIEKLLGGYATNTLTEGERRVLFEAALTDQALFDKLAGEEALKEVLEDPRTRRQIEQALAEAPRGFLARFAEWMRRPQAWALAGTLAATAVLAVVVVRVRQSTPSPAEMAKLETSAAVAPAPSAAPVTAKPAGEAAPALADLEETRRTAPARTVAPEPRRLDEAARAWRYSPPETVTAGKEVAAAPPPVAAKPAPPTPPLSADAGRIAPSDSRSVNGPASEGRAAAVGGARPTVVAEKREAEADALAKRNESASVQLAAPATHAELKDANKAAAPVFGMVSKRDRQVPLELRYRIFAKGADGQYAEQSPKVQQAPGTQVRVLLEANQTGFLYVNGKNGMLLSTQAIPGRQYAVDPQPDEQQLNVVLSRAPIAVPVQDEKAKFQRQAKAGARAVDDHVEVNIDLPTQQVR